LFTPSRAIATHSRAATAPAAKCRHGNHGATPPSPSASSAYLAAPTATSTISVTGPATAADVALVANDPWYQIGIMLHMAMTLRLSEEQTEALRRRAAAEDRSMQQVALAALDDYLLRAEDDELTDRLAEQGAQRFAELLRRLGE
jgi:predicted transcriptional regulator